MKARTFAYNSKEWASPTLSRLFLWQMREHIAQHTHAKLLYHSGAPNTTTFSQIDRLKRDAAFEFCVNIARMAVHEGIIVIEAPRRPCYNKGT